MKNKIHAVKVKQIAKSDVHLISSDVMKRNMLIREILKYDTSQVRGRAYHEYEHEHEQTR